MSWSYRCVALALALLSPSSPSARAQSLIPGLDGYADAVTGRSTAKWVGQRVPFPAPQARPVSLGRVRSLGQPVAVHATRQAHAQRLARVLRFAEQSMATLRASGLFAMTGDAGQGETAERDLYLVEGADTGALLDATEPTWGLDAGRAFAVVDARVPEALLEACTAQALVEAELFELDPAEAIAVRRASAQAFTRLLLGEACSQADGDERDTLHHPDALARWLLALSERQDRNRGAYLQAMWHFARQRTWEGTGLRGSPDLFEAIGASLKMANEALEEIAGELAARAFLASPELSADHVPFSSLPAHRPVVTPPLMTLDSAYLLIDLEKERPGERLTVWFRGESPVRWILSATRLDRSMERVATLNAPIRKYPEGELQVELDAVTRFLLVSITHGGNGKVDPDLPSDALARSVRLIVDRAR